MERVHQRATACLITPGHIAANPRLVKEAMALSRAGIKVHIIFTQYVEYLIGHDQQILNANPEWTYQSLNWTGNSFSSKIVRVTGGFMRFIPNINTKINRNFFWQLRKAIACAANIYIAHNPGSMPVAVLAAKKNKVKCGFDAEDFHRYETSNDENNADVKLKIAIENANIPHYDYITAASPLIAERYTSLFKREDIVTVLNVFPKTNNVVVNNTNNPLKLFWFSQTVGRNRGLETVIESINISGVKMDLHLLGNVDDDYKKRLLAINDKHGQIKATIHFHSPVPGDEIFKLTPAFDIGIAAEPGFSINNMIALSNKLFTYVQCGLAVIASNTPAQGWFMEQYPQTGKLYNNADELTEVLLTYHHNRKLLYQTKQVSYNIGQTKLNWEIESEKFIEVISKALTNS